MKVALIYPETMKSQVEGYACSLIGAGHTVRRPDAKGSGCERAQHMLDILKDADEVHVFWDGRSCWVLFDLGMAFSIGATVRVVVAPQSGSTMELLREWEAKCG